MKVVVFKFVAAPPERVFAALVDRAVLQRCIPGADSFVEIGPDAYEATVQIGVAPIVGSYRSKVVIQDRQPPQSLTIGFEGRGAPGFVGGEGGIGLAAEGDATRVAIVADLQVSGLFAIVGQRLIEMAAQKLADDFFNQLATELQSA
ncbi:MAG TPA: carbon monoxide dehydrogenase subunit G [Vicinamibacterales bacterium]|nr:carbon monoxide dehydrogenase subunit G [Vicinamibacterales bacterium]